MLPLSPRGHGGFPLVEARRAENAERVRFRVKHEAINDVHAVLFQRRLKKCES